MASPPPSAAAAMLRLLILASAAASTLLFASFCSAAAADTSKCAQVLVALTPCLAYVQGTATLPSKSCCSAVLPIHTSEPQCLCALIVAASEHDPKLPANLNLTLALSLGPACNIATDPSRCPDLLGLAPDSPDAKIFTPAPAAANSTSTGGGDTSSPGSTSSPSTSKPPATASLGQGQTPSSASASILNLLSAIVLPLIFSAALA